MPLPTRGSSICSWHPTASSSTSTAAARARRTKSRHANKEKSLPPWRSTTHRIQSHLLQKQATVSREIRRHEMRGHLRKMKILGLRMGSLKSAAIQVVGLGPTIYKQTGRVFFIFILKKQNFKNICRIGKFSKMGVFRPPNRRQGACCPSSWRHDLNVKKIYI